jgi:hypothetical protein
MKSAIEKTNEYFESASNRTPQYLSWFRIFKNQYTKFLASRDAENIQISKPNHFDMSGFFTLRGKIWYFRIGDLRWSKDSMLIRTAESYSDYTGGSNGYVSLATYSRFIKEFENITA